MLAAPERRGKKLSAPEDELWSCRSGALTARTMILILCRILYHVGMKSTRSIVQFPSAVILLSWLTKQHKEKFFRKDNTYDYLISISHNYKKIPKKGSAIFIHLTESYNPTAGCIALKKKDFEILLKLIDQKTKIKIG